MDLLDPSTLFTEDSEYEALEVLKRTLVLCPVYDRPMLPTEQLLQNLRDCGATVHINRGVSDVALHRCLITKHAFDLIKQLPDKFDTVFWLDGDMTGSPLHVAALCKLAANVDACVNGLCSKKNDSKAWALQRVKAPSETAFGVELTPVVCGLACMAMPVTALQHLAAKVPWFTLSQDVTLPALFQSRIGDSGQWQSEDIHFCVHAWEHGVGVFSAPIPFGHLTTFAVFPDPEGDWLPGDIGIRAMGL